MHLDRDAGAGQQCRCRRPRLLLAYLIAGEHGPDEARLRVPAGKLDERAAAADLDVIAMRAEAEHRASARDLWLESQRHGPLSASVAVSWRASRIASSASSDRRLSLAAISGRGVSPARLRISFQR